MSLLKRSGVRLEYSSAEKAADIVELLNKYYAVTRVDNSIWIPISEGTMPLLLLHLHKILTKDKEKQDA